MHPGADSGPPPRGETAALTVIVTTLLWRGKRIRPRLKMRRAARTPCWKPCGPGARWVCCILMDETPVQIGPGRPPPGRPWKPGESGNPRGKPPNPFKHVGVAMRVLESFADPEAVEKPDWKPSIERQFKGLKAMAQKNKDVQKELAKHYFARAFKELDRAEDGEEVVDPGVIVEKVLERFRASSVIFAEVLRGALEDPMLVPIVVRAMSEAAFARPAVMEEITGRLGVRAPVVVDADVNPMGGEVP